ncbi:hypothetical protein BD289DRAFT_441063 [Coniella lustricola]|uniref:Chromo domain-containing protein n=1 Tax=Coniella lustricola TaxID=2025994 RepID=A0A2T2ZZT4_9PEZI|nr:hypothetical protein BD289DRAFT_441063 [Coniella lustricola]
MDVYDFCESDEKFAQAAKVSAVLHIARQTPTSSRSTPRSKSTPRAKAAAVPTPSTAPPKMGISKGQPPSSNAKHAAAVKKSKPAARAKSVAKNTKASTRPKPKSSSEQLYKVEAIIGMRRANDWTQDNHTFQYAVQWEGYEQVTWNTPEVLDNYPLVLCLLTDMMERSSDSDTVPFYAPQPPGEADGAEFTGA